MADLPTVKEVKIEFTGDIGKLKRAMKEASAHQKDMHRTSRVMRKEGLRGYKDMAKATSLVSKGDRNRLGKQALQHERDLQRQIRATSQAIREQTREFKGNANAAKEEYEQLKRLTAQLQQVRSVRRSLGVRSFGERVGGAARSAGAASGAFLSEVGSSLKSSLAGLITGALGASLGVITSQIQAAYQQRVQFGEAYGGLAGLSGGGRQAMSITGTSLRGQAAALGYAPAEMAQMAGGVARATGRLGGANLLTAMQFQRGTGMDASGIMGALTQAGTGFGGSGGRGGRQEMVKMLALGLETGLERARMPEFFDSLQSLLERQAGVSAGAVSGMPAAELLAKLQMSGLSGFMGARGGAVVSAIDQAIRQPGGGEAGQALMLQAFGFGKPGGTATYYEALKRQEQGIYGKGNAKALFDEVNRQYGGGEAGILALREMTGLSISQLEALRDVINRGGSDEEIAGLASRGKDDFGSAAQMKALGDTTRHLAELSNRLVSLGNKFKEPIERLQHRINQAVDAAADPAAKALNLVADGVDEVIALLKRRFGEEGRAEAEENIEAWKEKVQKGELTAEQAMRMLRREYELARANLIDPMTANEDPNMRARVNAYATQMAALQRTIEERRAEQEARAAAADAQHRAAMGGGRIETENVNGVDPTIAARVQQARAANSSAPATATTTVPAGSNSTVTVVVDNNDATDRANLQHEVASSRGGTNQPTSYGGGTNQ